MTMTSGLNPRTLRVDAAPGVKWVYNTDAYQKLRQVLEVAAGSDINTISIEWLFQQIGIADGAWQVRPGAQDATGDDKWGLRITAREMARFGLFVARNGQWMGTQITDPGWFAEAWTATPLKADYGLIWWLSGKGRLAANGAPPDLVAGLGAMDQKLYVSPSTGIVVARQGNAAGETTEAGSDFDALLIEALTSALA
jgi:CubicO group peptidase (beta-lactamase class C family)